MFPMSLKITLYGRLISGTGGGFRAASLACDPDRDLPIQASYPAQRYLADPGGGSSKPA